MSTDDAAIRIARAVIEYGKRERADRPDWKFTVAEMAAAIRPELAILFPKAAGTRKVGGRDTLFDAIAEVCGVDLAGLTREYAKKIATAKRDILEASPDLSPDEIRTRAEAWRKKYPTCALTPQALSNHWPSLGSAGKLTRGAKRDVYIEPDAWKESEGARAAMNASPETWEIIVARGWFDLAVDIRATILRALP